MIRTLTAEELIAELAGKPPYWPTDVRRVDETTGEWNSGTVGIRLQLVKDLEA